MTSIEVYFILNQKLFCIKTNTLDENKMNILCRLLKLTLRISHFCSVLKTPSNLPDNVQNNIQSDCRGKNLLLPKQTSISINVLWQPVQLLGAIRMMS